MNNVFMWVLTKLKIDALDITRNNYKTWVVDAKMHLRGNEVFEIIDINYIGWEKDKAMIIYTTLIIVYKMRCIMRKDLKDLW